MGRWSAGASNRPKSSFIKARAHGVPISGQANAPTTEWFAAGQAATVQLFREGRLGRPKLAKLLRPRSANKGHSRFGKWSEADIIKAVRTGVRPDGRQLVPIMPYHSYGKLTDADAKALAGHLKSLKPVRNQVPGPVGINEKPSAPYLSVVTPQ
jgi:hypothetical protein